MAVMHVPVTRSASYRQQVAAERLGAIYLAVRKRGASLNSWAISPQHYKYGPLQERRPAEAAWLGSNKPPEKQSALEKLTRALPPSPVDNSGPFYQALAEVYWDPAELERNALTVLDPRGLANGKKVLYRPQIGFAGLRDRYKQDFDAAVPAVLGSAQVFAEQCLEAEIEALQDLLRRLLTDRGLAESLHRASKEILDQSRYRFPREVVLEEARVLGEPAPDPMPALGPELGPEPTPEERRIAWGGSAWLPTSNVLRLRRELARTLARELGDMTIQILVEHPESLQILWAYRRSPQAGTEASTTRVADALRALRGLADAATEDGHVFRYPFFVVGGVVRLNLQSVPGFKEYVVELAEVLARDSRVEALTVGQMAIGCIALAMGPAAPVAAVLLAGADLIFTGVTLGITFMREREQDLGSQGSALRSKENQFATPVVYGDTVLGGAAALVSAIGVFSAGVGLRKVLNAPAKGVGAATTPIAKKTAPAALSQSGLPDASQTVGGRATSTAAPAPKAGEPLVGPKQTTAAASEPRATSPGSTSTTPETTSLTLPPEDLPTKTEAPGPRAKSPRSTDEPVDPSSRKTPPAQRSEDLDAAASRGVLSPKSAQVGRAVAEEINGMLTVHKHDLDWVRGEIEKVLANLEPSPANEELIELVRTARDALEDPNRIARIAAKIQEEAERIIAAGTKPSAAEEKFLLVTPESRATARLAGFSDETAGEFKLTPRGEDSPDSSDVFFSKFKDKYIIDRQFKDDDHGLMTHIFQDLVIEDALAEKGFHLTGPQFRLKLHGARGPQYPHGNETMETGTKLFAELFDSGTEHPNTPHRPERLRPLLIKSELMLP
jgi:hypothetical protein